MPHLYSGILICDTLTSLKMQAARLGKSVCADIHTARILDPTPLKTDNGLFMQGALK